MNKANEKRNGMNDQYRKFFSSSNSALIENSLRTPVQKALDKKRFGMRNLKLYYIGNEIDQQKDFVEILRALSQSASQ